MSPLRAALARGAYATLMRLLTPLLIGRLWLRARREPLYGHAVAERLGLGAATPPGALWLHAVSLGETRAAEPLIQALRAAHPGLRLLLTSGTATGRETATGLLRDGDAQRWLPIDTPGAVRRFLQRHRPAIGVLMETEVWPVLQHEAARAGVPMVIANARLSERSLQKAHRLDALMRPAVATLAVALAQTEADAQRLRVAGAPQVQVSGNLKFDLVPEPALLARGHGWRGASAGRPVVLAASWREGEDEPLLSAWVAAMARWQGDAARRPRLLLVPRHPQRFDEVAAMVQAHGLSLSRRSGWGEELASPADPGAAGADVWLGDSMREMPAYYALADVALLGGSFAPLGGQNLIEAAACGCPVVMGPHTFNFAEAAALAEQALAAQRVTDLVEAVQAAVALVDDSRRRTEMVTASKAYAALHQGAARRMAEAVMQVLASTRLG
ncbi:3-deoxy-D-manno-octulosonic-acid transferase [Sphaerotilus mobilis]|uniref:3-deoxy-D-manno-octulosonic acid transferase n=2 Tax=Sphaerotilus mobilis TaxID=47994 RepID=A0A4Q7LRR7_9BURK|nr:3-deoxy-D-manno-octulosonic acid transferase [Sphaerotilus mobilis]RZS57201.1 3-deoxy-D-manno-octulosonic-acid transferase [Sphaerotilus mobilis]